MGTAPNPPSRSSTWRRQFNDPQVRVAITAAACLLAEAAIAKNVLDVDLDFMSQLAPMWMLIVFLLSGLRDQKSEILFTITIVFVTIAILVLYAV